MTSKKQKGNNGEQKSMSKLGIETIGDLSGLMSEANKPDNSGPIHLSLDLIVEDPNQPRTEENPGFTKQSLEELASTISVRGVKSPISVRDNPEQPGHYIINHGARRYRASKLAQKETIPAFVDNDYNDADQVIENLQRNELTAREIADFIGRELAKGQKKGQIADSIGKSASFVSQHVTLLDLPDPIAQVFNSGRTGDVTVINELVKAYKNDPEDVTTWLNDDTQDITRNSVKLLREFIEDKKNNNQNDTIVPPNHTEEYKDSSEYEGNDTNSSIDLNDAQSLENEGTASNEQEKKGKDADPSIFKKAIVIVKHNERLARLILTQRPSEEGFAWIKFDEDGSEIEVDLGEVQLMALIEA